MARYKMCIRDRGYRAEKKGDTLVMGLGYSHPVETVSYTHLDVYKRQVLKQTSKLETHFQSPTFQLVP